ncbi:beta-microseminoprotein-like [Hypanus sabinus]|uniref:beta-microseminoprotein-like n=1 Tax=Hypanus sabinus TaxID=79690 RepID=UPI0028C4DB8A|nr:beta-microseminoprotein-like [Hypanus sabinus]XP_059821546.1 beta-microseminoprotein-like [Hypanus sabinus]XP_059821556.1 beta-microseminoprotein-like [Hypanus sabinus]XP_059821564.1 beta-microseminoprotein-like [Hypanus sabinus]XP_059821569.1 beta-microseminoprotein-like [Hypanus sabinus]
MAQRVIVCVALLLMAFDLCHGDCKFVMKTESECLEKGISHSVGSMWKSDDCYSCYCGKVTAICCTEYIQPPDVSNSCEVIFDKRLCRYKTYRKDNPNILCD